MMSPLKVINGGGGAGSKSQPSPKPTFRKHPFADFLWKAVYPHPAHSREQIAERMTKARARRVTVAQASATLRHVQDHQYEYEWTIPHVQKGSVGDLRRYFPILVDGNNKDYTVSEVDCIKAGTVSSLRTVRTMMEHQATALDILLESDAGGVDRGDKRQFRAAVSALDTSVRMVGEALTKIKANGTAGP